MSTPDGSQALVMRRQAAYDQILLHDVARRRRRERAQRAQKRAV